MLQSLQPEHHRTLTISFMKKTILAISICVAAITTITGLQSCGGLDNLVQINPVSDTASTDFVVPVTTDTAAITVSETVDIDSLLKAESAGAGSYSLVKTINLRTVTLTLTDADAANNFANFQSVNAVFSSSANGGSNGAYRVAEIDNNPDVFSATLSPAIIDADKNLKPYFDSKVTVSYTISGKLRRATTKPLHCHAMFGFTYTFGT